MFLSQYHFHLKSILAGYQYLFDGCCRGKAKTDRNLGDMSHHQCESECDKESKCIAIETNGWNKKSGQHGPCWLFTDSGEDEIVIGRCVTNGDQKCFEKIGGRIMHLSLLFLDFSMITA